MMTTHYAPDYLAWPACGQRSPVTTGDPGEVTCGACQRTQAYLTARLALTAGPRRRDVLKAHLYEHW